jgi:UV DNA damage endonuclease
MGLRRLGYPCIRRTAREQTVKRCQLNNATPERLRELIDRNLRCLRNVLEFNARHNIRLFRIHSDTIPFASHPEVDFDWLDYARDKLAELGGYIREENLRISMHPGQYTVLNSPDEDVVANARRNLSYHASFLDGFGVGPDAKIILHIGGVYDDRQAAIDRFVRRANSLPDTVTNRLVIENDETSYDIEQVLEIHERTGLPVVYDDLHHRLNAPGGERSGVDWLEAALGTWDKSEGPPKVHYSSPGEGSGGHHADRIDPEEFEQFLRETEDLPDFDVMLECKDKEAALFKLIEAVDWPFLEQRPDG